MIASARRKGENSPRIWRQARLLFAGAHFPGAAIMLSVLGFNLLGAGLRDALDPRLKP